MDERMSDAETATTYEGILLLIGNRSQEGRDLLEWATKEYDMQHGVPEELAGLRASMLKQRREKGSGNGY